MAFENKLGISNSAELAREEERISKKKAIELFENGVLDQLATQHLRQKNYSNAPNSTSIIMSYRGLKICFVRSLRSL